MEGVKRPSIFASDASHDVRKYDRVKCDLPLITMACPANYISFK
jgi:hypothetical protein